MVPGVRTEGPITHADERPTAVIGIRQAVCDAARDVVGYEVLTGVPETVLDLLGAFGFGQH